MLMQPTQRGLEGDVCGYYLHETRRSRHGDLVISEMIHIFIGVSQRLTSYEPWSTEHDGTSQLQSTVTVSRESWSTEHDGTSQLGSKVIVSRNGHIVT